MIYSNLLDVLREHSEKDFADFSKKLIPTKQNILGVRTPILRKLAKQYQSEMADIFNFPDEYYEITFIKLTQCAALPFDQFLLCVERCVEKIDNWATCDGFKAGCIANHQEEFLPVLERLFLKDRTFYRRYVFVTFLTAYMDEKWLSIIESYISRADLSSYYVHMAVAWLTAEILIKHYDFGVSILKRKVLDRKTHNKAIQKAIESYRISKEQKEYLRSLKILNNK